VQAGSVSRVKLVLEVIGKGICECELARHLAPFTVGTLLRSLPVEGRVQRLENKCIYFETGLQIGTEKQRTSYKRGDIAFMIANGSICVFLRDASNLGLNPIGKMISNMELIENSTPGDVLVLRSP
jgi:hypothetical protein